LKVSYRARWAPAAQRKESVAAGIFLEPQLQLTARLGIASMETKTDVDMMPTCWHKIANQMFANSSRMNRDFKTH